ncbi:MAG: HAD family hydrolase [Ruminococcaceae bacterium]|nr:HAD family hydrolase [Oscillospiraceae bacterium]
MGVKYVLFDLDGTLLPMDQEVFIKSYFGKLAKKLVSYGYDTEEVITHTWNGARRMVKNDGRATNAEVFWEYFTSVYGAERISKDMPVFDEFYRVDFDLVKADCGFNPEAAATVRAIRDMGLKVFLATNPIIPATATEHRIRWAGLEPSDFEIYTTFENCCYAKPNPKYYLELLDKIGAKPEECLMVGNDVDEDMMTRELGMKVFLLTDCLINKNNKDISQYPKGSFCDLLKYIDSEILQVK